MALWKMTRITGCFNTMKITGCFINKTLFSYNKVCLFLQLFLRTYACMSSTMPYGNFLYIAPSCIGYILVHNTKLQSQAPSFIKKCPISHQEYATKTNDSLMILLKRQQRKYSVFFCITEVLCCKQISENKCNTVLSVFFMCFSNSRQ